MTNICNSTSVINHIHVLKTDYLSRCIKGLGQNPLPLHNKSPREVRDDGAAF